MLKLHARQLDDARTHFSAAVSLFTLVHNEPYRLAALYNAANVERECGNAAAAADLYVRARDLATTLGHRDVTLGAEAGAGLAAMRQGRTAAARLAADTLRTEMIVEGDRWFQGREMVEALLIRTAIEDGDGEDAILRYRDALAVAERHDPYGGAWLAAELQDLAALSSTNLSLQR